MTRARARRRIPLVAAVALVAALIAADAPMAKGELTGRSTAAPGLEEQTRVVGARKPKAAFGTSVALSGNGNLALVGAPREGATGAAWIYERRGTGWTSTRLPGRGRWFGYSVALAANGRTAVIGAPTTDGSKGAAWVFTTRGGGTWVGTRLKPRDREDDARFGYAVALSDNGATAIVGGPYDDLSLTSSLRGRFGRGAVWTFDRSIGWRQAGDKLTDALGGARSGFGASVAISAIGKNAIVGSPGHNENRGRATTFMRLAPDEWTRGIKRDEELVTDGARFGTSVAMSDSGEVQVVGSPFDRTRGMVWIYKGLGGPRAPVIRDARSGDQLGASVAISGDGSVVLAGGPGHNGREGAAWVSSGSESRLLQGKAVAGAARLGSTVAISTSGDDVVIGGPGDRNGTGAAWIYGRPPSVRGVSPDEGPTAGGTAVEIVGDGFRDVRGVRFGANAASSFRVESSGRIAAVTPPGQGDATVTVTTTRGTSAVEGTRFRYVAPPAVTAIAPTSGPTTGGTEVTITGTSLVGIRSVAFGGMPATSLNSISQTQVKAVSPPGTGTVDVTVTTRYGTSPPTASARFTYIAPIVEQVISFDSIVTGGLGQALVPVTTQFASQGVTFSGVAAIDYAKGAAIPGFARSGSIGIESCAGVEFCTVPIRATFASAKTMIRVWVGFSFALNQPLQLQLRAMNAAGSLVGTATTTLPARPTPTPISVPLEVRAGSASITQLELVAPGGYMNSVAVDDVTFEGP